MLEIDAAPRPVKEKPHRVAGRYRLRVWVETNGWLRVPEDPLVPTCGGRRGLDCADDWIAERVGPADVAVTAHLPLKAAFQPRITPLRALGRACQAATACGGWLALRCYLLQKT